MAAGDKRAWPVPCLSFNAGSLIVLSGAISGILITTWFLFGFSAVSFENWYRVQQSEKPSHYISGTENYYVQHDLEPPLNLSTCLVLTVDRYGRDGNNLSQLAHLLRVLSLCTGFGMGWTPASNSGLWLPRIITTTGSSFSVDTLERIAQHCQHVVIDPPVTSFGLKLLADFLNETSCYARYGEHFESALREVQLDSTILHDMVRYDQDGLTENLTDTAVAHVRGGDLFQENPHFGYTPPPCSFYLESFLHSNASRLAVVAEDDHNPCVKFLQERLGERVKLVVGTSVQMAFVLIQRAPIFIPAFSTFSTTAMMMSIHPKQIVYSGDRTMVPGAFSGSRRLYDMRCTVKSNVSAPLATGLWNNTEAQRNALVNDPSVVTGCLLTSTLTV